MTEIEKQILADAIKTAIKTERTNIILNRLVIALSITVLALSAYVVYSL